MLAINHRVDALAQLVRERECLFSLLPCGGRKRVRSRPIKILASETAFEFKPKDAIKNRTMK